MLNEWNDMKWNEMNACFLCIWKHFGHLFFSSYVFCEFDLAPRNRKNPIGQSDFQRNQM
jgi:hypothetical protein